MSTTNPSIPDQIRSCNASLDRSLRRRFGITLMTYKLIKAVTQLAVVATGFYAIAEGADPTLTFALVATVVVGPEAVETIVVDGGNEP